MAIIDLSVPTRASSPEASELEMIVVTGTKLPADLESLPAMITAACSRLTSPHTWHRTRIGNRRVR